MKLCVIPARGGSKRIPRKNIKEFAGKPMIEYSISAALESNLFDDVIVSTDDAEIADIATGLGASTPFIRPKELSDDYVGTVAVVKHAIEACKLAGRGADVCCIYATAPFIRAYSVIDSYNYYSQRDVDYLFSATSYSFPIQRAIKLDKDNRVTMFNPEHSNTRSQDLEEAYHDAGQFYWAKSEVWLAERAVLTSLNSVAYLLPRYMVQDIDTLEDWTRAELMYQVLKNQGEL